MDWLPAALLIPRLQDAFRFLESDVDIGIRYTESLIRHLERLQKAEYLARRHEQIEHLSQRIPQALYLRYGDDPSSTTEFLETLLLPATPMVFRYSCQAHADAAYPLLKRSADLLGYSISELRGVDLVY